MRHSPCHKSLVFVLLKLREAYLSIAQVKESKKVNEVSDLYSLCSRHWKVLMGARKNRGCKGDTQGQRELSPLSCVYITHVSIIHPVLSHILFSSAFWADKDPLCEDKVILLVQPQWNGCHIFHHCKTNSLALWQMQALLNDLKYAAALSLKGETKKVTKQHQ